MSPVANSSASHSGSRKPAKNDVASSATPATSAAGRNDVHDSPWRDVQRSAGATAMSSRIASASGIVTPW